MLITQVSASGPREGPHPVLLSVVVPAYNEAATLPRLVAALEVELDALGVPFEVIVVDDRSTDGSFAVLRALRATRPWLRALRFSRNFGKEVAQAAGLRVARGEVVVQMDADLQHPPELIRAFLAAWREGADVAYAARDRRSERGGLRDRLARVFYRLFDSIAEVRIAPGGGDFALFDRKVVDVLNAMPERNRFGKGLYSWAGFLHCAVPYVPPPRADGQSRFRPLRLVRLAVDGLTSFSTLPLRMWTAFGLVVSLASLSYGGVIAFEALLRGSAVPGYPSLMVAVAFLGGVQLISLGVIGEYLGQVYMEVKRRPLFVIDERIGFERDTSESSRSAAMG